MLGLACESTKQADHCFEQPTGRALVLLFMGSIVAGVSAPGPPRRFTGLGSSASGPHHMSQNAEWAVPCGRSLNSPET
jgi:hypothetical protein